MKRTNLVILLSLGFMLVCGPYVVPSFSLVSSGASRSVLFEQKEQGVIGQNPGPKTGILSPVLIEHTGMPSGTVQYQSGRTDTNHNPSSEVMLPAGVEGSSFSADCSGGYFLVGNGGSVDFGSSSGTISLWIKWDVNAPHGRFWGQHSNFETRWENDRLRLDWGSDNTLLGTKNDWLTNHWYFISIVWDQSTNFLAIYWGDEEIEPIEDMSSSSWSDSVIGLLSQNDIMCSRGTASYSVDGHVDDFRYYTLARSLEDLRSDYNKQLSGTEEGLAHYYKFENDLTDFAGGPDLVPSGAYSFSQDVFIEESGWKAEQIQLDVRNLRILHALNGTFESGNPGTNVNWDEDGSFYADGWRARRDPTGESDTQRASYIDTSTKYLVLENQGDYRYPTNSYRHYNGTNIYWYQIVNNSRLTEQFEFSMNYLYQRGPIGTNYAGVFRFGFDILNGSDILWSWSVDPTNITQRGIWYESSQMIIDIPNAPSTFEIRISLSVNTTSSYVEIPEDDPDVDGDSANGRFITFQLDDVSLVATQAPNLENVELAVDFPPLGMNPISGGNGIGAIVLDYKYWRRAINSFSFSSNSSVSFEYSVMIKKMTRFYNSTYSQNPQDLGVAYNVEPNQMLKLTLYTYIQSYPEARDIGIRVHYPLDWSNPRVQSPLGKDVINLSFVEPGCFETSSGIVNIAGSWKVIMNGTNYIDSVTTQVLTLDGSTWNDASEFHSGDKIRCLATIGTESHTFLVSNNVEFDWYTSSGGIWLQEVVGNSNSSLIVSQEATFAPINSSIGAWIVTVSWTNGSMVAYGLANFELHHRLTIFAHTPDMEAKSGDGFTAKVHLYDQDNGNPILSDADVIGNWSTNSVQFSPNLAKGWWEADFNTTTIGTGDFVIIVQVELPFYDPSNTEINIHIPNPESLFDVTLRGALVGALLVTGSFVAITLGRRFYMSTTSKRNLELLAMQSRLDDARNLIGLLVIHRGIGLPVYSNILKGGFQESILSSLITAISQFRSEFSIDEPMWTAIPITEVVMAVQTESLICAIITVDPASIRQKEELETFSREVGGLYDHENDTIRQMVRSPTLSDTFDSIFASYFDGNLMKKYVGVKRNLPRPLSPVSSTLDTMDIHRGVSVDAIIKATSVLGYSERRAHQMVLEAVDGDFLIPAETRLPEPLSSEE